MLHAVTLHCENAVGGKSYGMCACTSFEGISGVLGGCKADVTDLIEEVGLSKNY